jgi:ketosteroid isomerase-like protein
MIKSVEVKDILVDGARACVLTRYEIQVPGRPTFESHVAELFEVRDGKIQSLDIYFDSSPFPK